MTYKEHEDTDDEQVADAPVSPCLKVIRQSELSEDDEEAIEWSEIQRLIFQQMWGPILDLPVREEGFFAHREFEDGVDVSAFNTHDFRRLHPRHSSKYSYALGQAKREYREAICALEVIMGRIQHPSKYLVLFLVKRGVLEPEMCVGDMQRAAMCQRRLRTIGKKIEEIEDARYRAREEQAKLNGG